MTFEVLQYALLGKVFYIVAVVTVVLLISRYAFSGIAHFQKYSFTKEALERDNKAVLIRLAGLFFGVIIAFKSAFTPIGLGILFDLAKVFEILFWVLGALFASMWVNDKAILYHFDNNKEVIEKQNVAVAVVEASTMVATAFIFSGAFTVSDEAPYADNTDMFMMEGWWFFIGQLMLVSFAVAYRVVVRDAVRYLQEQNTAVALSMGGFLIGSGITLGTAVAGPFNGWVVELTNVGMYMTVWLLVMMALRLVVNYAIIRGKGLRHELVVDKNWGVGLVDGTLSIAISMAFIRLVG